MIQAPQPKPAETKAPSKLESTPAVKNLKGKASASTKAPSETQEKEFASELEAKLKGHEVNTSALEAEIRPVQVADEKVLELPSSLVQPDGTIETTTPKVFDPEVTKGVQELIQPKTSAVEAKPLTDAQVLELAEGGQVDLPVPAEATLKADFMKSLESAPKLADASGGRSPSIDFGKAEIDPQLLNNEDFVAQKNLVSRKVVSNPYGMKHIPQEQRVAMEDGLRPNQIVKGASAEDAPMNSQQFILNLNNEGSSANQMTNEVQAPVKTFDMSHVKSSNPTEIMNQITDYVVQAKAAKEPTVNMRVNHDELGTIDITVSKMSQQQDAITVNIGTHSADGKAFFQQNSKDLFSHLSNAGLNVADLKVETSSQTAKSDFDFGSQSGRNQEQGSSKQFGSEQNQRRHESDRRQELWKLLNKEAA